jgi:hypothetical protein
MSARPPPLVKHFYSLVIAKIFAKIILPQITDKSNMQKRTPSFAVGKKLPVKSPDKREL